MFLSWKVYPTYKIFIDQRNLDYQVYEEYGKAKKGEYSDIFNKHNVNTVIFYHTQPIISQRPEIIVKLLSDPVWQLVYIDKLASVFVRASQNKHLPVIDKKQAIAYLNSTK